MMMVDDDDSSTDQSGMARGWAHHQVRGVRSSRRDYIWKSTNFGTAHAALSVWRVPYIYTFGRLPRINRSNAFLVFVLVLLLIEYLHWYLHWYVHWSSHDEETNCLLGGHLGTSSGTLPPSIYYTRMLLSEIALARQHRLSLSPLRDWCTVSNISCGSSSSTSNNLRPLQLAPECILR